MHIKCAEEGVEIRISEGSTEGRGGGSLDENSHQ